MKRIIAITLILSMLMCVSAMAQTVVTATTYPLYDLAKIVCGKNAMVVYDEKGQTSEGILLYCGESIETPENVVGLNAIDSVDAIEDCYDALTIPVNCALVAFDLAEAMSIADPENAELYTSNMEEYSNSMFELDMLFRTAVAEDTVVYCPDGSMFYFATEYGTGVSTEEMEGTVQLMTYNTPDSEDLEIPYIELMGRNLARLTGEQVR